MSYQEIDILNLELVNYFVYNFSSNSSVINQSIPKQDKIVQTTEWLEMEYMFGLILLVFLLMYFFGDKILGFIETTRNKTNDNQFASIVKQSRVPLVPIEDHYTNSNSIFYWIKQPWVKRTFVFAFVLLFTIMSYKEMLGIVEQPPIPVFTWYSSF